MDNESTVVEDTIEKISVDERKNCFIRKKKVLLTKNLEVNPNKSTVVEDTIEKISVDERKNCFIMKKKFLLTKKLEIIPTKNNTEENSVDEEEVKVITESSTLTKDTKISVDKINIPTVVNRFQPLKEEIPELSSDDEDEDECDNCLLYTSPSPRDRTRSRMPSSA